MDREDRSAAMILGCQERQKENNDSQLLEEKVQETSEGMKNIRLNTIDSKIQGSQGTKRHSVPLALS